MRPNTAALVKLPEYSTPNGIDGKPYSLILCNSTQHAQQLTIDHARTENEKGCSWHVPSFIGLKNQTIQEFDQTKKATYPLQCLESALARLDQKTTRPGGQRMAVTGGFWDTPSVIAALPLSARTRVRTKLPPKNIRIFIVYSGGVSSETMAPLTARIAKALWQYTLAGGAVSLTVQTGSAIRGQTGRAVIETRVNTSDVSALALALSPVFMRSISAALLCALSDKPSDSLPILRDPITPGVYFLSDIGPGITKVAEKIIADLAIV